MPFHSFSPEADTGTWLGREGTSVLISGAPLTKTKSFFKKKKKDQKPLNIEYAAVNEWAVAYINFIVIFVFLKKQTNYYFSRF